MLPKTNRRYVPAEPLTRIRLSPLPEHYSWSAVADASDLELALVSLERSPKPAAVNDLICILQKCRKLGDPACAKRLGSYMHRENLQGHAILGNYLVSMLADCGCAKDAEQVMERLQFRNHYSWNALIWSYVEHRKLDLVFHLYQRMRSDGVHPTTYTFVALLKVCGDLKDLEKGRELRNETVEMGLEKDVFVGNALIDMFGKCDSIAEAEEVFSNLSARDVVSWTSLITAYVGHGCHREALCCFLRMGSEGALPNAVTYMVSLQACSSIPAMQSGQLIYAEVLKRGLDNHVHVGNTCLDMFCKCGFLEEAQVVFDKLPLHDAITWNVLMAGYVESGQDGKALDLFEKLLSESKVVDSVAAIQGLKACSSLVSMRKGQSVHIAIVKTGLEKNLVLGNMLVHMFGKCGLLEDAQAVFDKLPTRDSASWSSLMMGYTQYDQAGKALDCIEEMRLQGLSPDHVICACGLRSCHSLSAIVKGHEMHCDIAKYGFDMDSVIGSALVDMYGDCGLLIEARKVFDKLPERNLTTWSAMIKGCGINHQGDIALQYFYDMQGKGIKPDPIAFTSLLVACSQANIAFQKGHQHLPFVTMELGQNAHHISYIVHLLARSGRVKEAVDTLRCWPSTETWRSLLTACDVYGEIRLGLTCLKHLLDASQ